MLTIEEYEQKKDIFRNKVLLNTPEYFVSMAVHSGLIFIRGNKFGHFMIIDKDSPEFLKILRIFEDPKCSVSDLSFICSGLFSGGV
jgi:hypothetical protein